MFRWGCLKNSGEPIFSCSDVPMFRRCETGYTSTQLYLSMALCSAFKYRSNQLFFFRIFMVICWLTNQNICVFFILWRNRSGDNLRPISLMIVPLPRDDNWDRQLFSTSIPSTRSSHHLQPGSHSSKNVIMSFVKVQTPIYEYILCANKCNFAHTIFVICYVHYWVTEWLTDW